MITDTRHIPATPARVTGVDGKTYPSRPLSKLNRDRLILLAHALHHEGLSVRQVVHELDTVHGVTRSVGSVSDYLNRYLCPDCSGVLNAPPEHPEHTPGSGGSR